MTQTLRRELRIKLKEVCQQYLSSIPLPLDCAERFIDDLADAALEVAGIQKKELPVDWQIAGGVSSEEIAETSAKIQAQKAKSDTWERKMGYNPLGWNTPDMEALLRFLMDKTDEEIETFAEWSRAKYSSFSPAKARQHPRQVIELWPQAFQGETNDADPRTQRLWRDGGFVDEKDRT